MSGMLISLEGIDGSGKSTQADRLLNHLRAAGHTVTRVREPGSTGLSEAIRGMLLEHTDLNLSDRAEAMLFSAARAQLVDEVILPALSRSEVIICDRFSDSTIAYQGYGRELPLEQISNTQELVTRGLVPSVSILFDLSVADSLARRAESDDDRMEAAGAAFLERVRNGYLALAAKDAQRWLVVDATGSIEHISGEIIAHVESRIERP
ncbi:MAG: dTMP kinase [Candidatus Marinimicrobia bacterium]|nr:dTMP kinase [Candidatus Neomarinimicrobiota bacterium]